MALSTLGLVSEKSNSVVLFLNSGIYLSICDTWGKCYLKENLRGLHQKESKFKCRDISQEQQPKTNAGFVEVHLLNA